MFPQSLASMGTSSAVALNEVIREEMSVLRCPKVKVSNTASNCAHASAQSEVVPFSRSSDGCVTLSSSVCRLHTSVYLCEFRSVLKVEC